MTGAEYTQRCIRQLGIATGVGPDFFAADHAVATEQALQEIWLVPLSDEWKRRNQDITATSGDASYELPAGIQEVCGPVWFDGAPLNPATDEAAFAALSDHYDTYLSETAARPCWYHVETLWAGSSAEDAKAMTIELCPTPVWTTPVEGVTITKILKVRAIFQPPTFTAAQLASALTVIPMPDGYIASLLIPLTLDRMTGLPWFADERLRQKLAEDAERARMLMGLSKSTKAEKDQDKQKEGAK